MNPIMMSRMMSRVHDEAGRLHVAAALLAETERSAAGCLADASPMSVKMTRTITMVESISWVSFTGPTPNREPKPKFHARGTVSRINAIVVCGVHDDARRLRVAAASWPQMNAWPLAVAPMLGRQAGRPFAMTHGIPVDRGRNAFLSAAAFLVHCCPGYALGFTPRDS